MSTSEDPSSSRSRRGPSKTKERRALALERLKAAKEKRWTYSVEDEMTDNVYDVVDEKEYCRKVQARLDDDFIVDDDGQYVEDGREIFDEEYQDNQPGRTSSLDSHSSHSKSRCRSGTSCRRSGGSKRKADSGDEAKKKKSKSIKRMLLNMPAKKVEENTGGSIENDPLFKEMLQDLRERQSKSHVNFQSKNSSVKNKSDNDGGSKHGVHITPKERTRETSVNRTPFAVRAAQPPRNRVSEEDRNEHGKGCDTSAFLEALDRDERAKEGTGGNDDSNEALMKSVVEDEDPFRDDDESIVTEETDIGKVTFNEQSEIAKDAIEKSQGQEDNSGDKSLKLAVPNRGFMLEKEDEEERKTHSSSIPSFDPLLVDDKTSSNNCTPSQLDTLEELPMVTLPNGDKVLRLFWLDAFEDPFKHAGTVWLFGKVECRGAFVSCCVQVKNIGRRVYLLKRENRLNIKTNENIESEKVSIGDVYNEFASKIADRYRISEHRSKPVRKLYAFDHTDVPAHGEYLEVHYDSKYNALPSDLRGETFSRVFGTNQSCLEKILIDKKIKGPSWLDIKGCRLSNPQISWCRVEAICDDDDELISSPSCNISPPPLTVLCLRPKTIVNPKTMLHEVVLVSGLVHNDFRIDRPAPKPAFNSCFCCITRPQDEQWPFDFATELRKQSIKIDKVDSERLLLSYLVARIGKIDPDVIVGHDVATVDTEILMHRLQRNKVIHWSRVSRLKRGHVPTNKTGRIVEKMAFTGRLVCDLKISSKELIRCKSYDLSALVEKLLSKSCGNRAELKSDELRRAYSSSPTLLQMCNAALTESLDILQCVYDLNALPLALQITRVAGNVMSRTLLGGRAERNEYLLLHAFTDKNFICPDKQYASKKNSRSNDNFEDEAEGNQVAKRGAKKKPAYTGGLVLDPKVGFYDKYVLLMDFNSLYPSIIQEYNICFTTVARHPPASSQLSVDSKMGGESKGLERKGSDVDEWIPNLPDGSREIGVLPTEIRKLVESRKAVKNLLKDPKLSAEKRMQYDIRQKALKLTANSMYGCLGFSHSRFFAKPMAALITAKGREILLQTKGLVERLELEVIYGDTDSLMINSNTQDFNEVMKMGTKIKQEVNKLYKLLELDVDGVYKFMLLLKKKKYAAVAVQLEKSSKELLTSIELKGLDIVRRDWSQLASDVGRNILEKILSDCNNDDRVLYIHETLENLAILLKEGKVPLQHLAITKQLTKSPNEYGDSKALPHVQVAQRLNSKGHRRLRQGDTVAYVICEDGTKNPATQRAYDVEEVKVDRSLSVDVNYYLAQQIHPVVSRLCEPLDGTDSSRIAGSLGLDPNSYRGRIAISSSSSYKESRESLKGEEERFGNCSFLEIQCKSCTKKIILRTATSSPKRSTDSVERVLALAQCPSFDCDARPIVEWVTIQNHLLLEIRSHVRRFYQSILVCEDPACNGRRKALNLNFVGVYPKCRSCNNALMCKEYDDRDLYRQLLYYQNLFDIRRHELRYKLGAIDVEVRRSYERLKNFIDGVMKSNRYSIIDMAKLFAGYNPVKAARFRHNNNNSSNNRLY